MFLTMSCKNQNGQKHLAIYCTCAINRSCSVWKIHHAWIYPKLIIFIALFKQLYNNALLTTFMMDFSQDMELLSWDTHRDSWAGLEALATAFLHIIRPWDTCMWSEGRSPSSSSSFRPVLAVMLARLICTLQQYP